MNGLIELIRQRSKPLVPRPTDALPHLKQLSGLRCLALDIYGTLFLSAAGNLSPSPFSDLIAREHQFSKSQGTEYPEVDIREIWRTHFRRSGLAPDDKLLAWHAVNHELHHNPVWPAPGALKLLTRARRAGLILALVSNAQFYTPLYFEALLGQSLKELGFEDHFILLSYQHQQAKPGTFLFQQLRQNLASHGVTPDQVLYLGNDAHKDIAPSVATGFRSALYAGCARSYRPCSGTPSPELIVKDLATLANLLE